ncbi:MAG TPA: hypothetical protein VLZ75_04190 [Chitinophagales bacterium]|nr:hypothetical protein [Chitinophagales bacterium]
MKTFANFSIKILSLLFLITLITVSSCKKDKDIEKVQKNASLIGEWSNVQQIGKFTSIVRSINLKSDGTGISQIYRYVSTSSTAIADDKIKWSTKSNNVLQLDYEIELVETYTYKIGRDEAFNDTVLTLTDENGTEIDYLKAK